MKDSLWEYPQTLGKMEDLSVEKGAQLLKTYGADGLFVDEDHHVYLTEGMKERFSLLADSYSVEDILE